MTASPWDYEVTLVSPDGSKTARIEKAMEIAMSAPTRGTLVLSTGLVLEGCNPSMVWSDDSRYLAVPRWEGRKQRLVVIDTWTQQVRQSNPRYHVLELTSFSGGIIRGLDSPVYRPQALSVDISTAFGTRQSIPGKPRSRGSERRSPTHEDDDLR